MGALLALSPARVQAQQGAVQPDATFGTAGRTGVGLDGVGGPIGETSPPQWSEPLNLGKAVQANNRFYVCGGTAGSFVVKCYLSNGTPDPAFGTAGTLTVDFEDRAEARDLFVQPDGLLVAAGARQAPLIGMPPLLIDVPALARFSPTGVLDAGFGTGGKVTGNVNTGPNFGLIQLVVLGNGNLLGVGVLTGGQSSGSTPRLVSYLPNGQLNTAFNNGTAAASLGDLRVRQMRLLPDGRVLLAGQGPPLAGGTKPTAAVMRLTATGQPDASFGIGGMARLNGTQTSSGVTSPAYTEAHAVDVQPADGKIVLVGRVHYDASISAGNLPVLLRLNPDGTPDAAFNAATDRTLYNTGRLLAVAAQPNGSILVGGAYIPFLAAGPRELLARYTAAGQLDATFNPAAPPGPGYVPAGAYAPALPSNLGSVGTLLVQASGNITTLGGYERRPGQTGATGLLLSSYRLVTVSATRPEAAVLRLQASPVPAAEAVQLSYTLPGAAAVRAVLRDPLGRVVGPALDAGRQAAGPQVLTLDVRSLAAGVYSCTLEAGAWRQSTRLVVAP